MKKFMFVNHRANRAIAIMLIACLAVLPASDAQAAPSEEKTEEVQISQTEDTALDTKGSQKSETGTDNAYVSDEIIVVYDDAGVSEKKSEKIQNTVEKELASSDIEVSETVAEASKGQGTVVVAELPEDMSVEKAIEIAEESSDVSYAQPNFVYQIMEDIADVADNTEPEESQEDPESKEDTVELEEETEIPDSDTGSVNDGLDEGASETEIPDGNLVETQKGINDHYYKNYSPESKNYPYYLDAINVPGAWDSVTCDRTISVAVIDTGCRMDHDDLKMNIDAEHARDTTGTEPVPLTASSSGNGDSSGHGTHVCGLVAAEANNNIGIAGTSYNAKIIPIRVFNTEGKSYTSYVINALEYCETLASQQSVNLRVINMSLGYYPGGSGEADEDISVKNKIAQLKAQGVLSVCAGGNGDGRGTPYTDTMYPSDFEDCLSVTSLTRELKDSAWSDYNACKDISAPGEEILSTYNSSKDTYAFMGGSSMASPIVAGVCALIFKRYPRLSVEDVIEGIKATAKPIKGQDTKRSQSTGSAGLIDAEAVLDYFDTAASEGISIQDANIVLEKKNYLYCRSAITPKVTVTLGGQELTKGKDYEVYYSDNKNAGTANVKIKGIGIYTGSKKESFTITPVSIENCTVQNSIKKNYLYSAGTEVTPEIGMKYQNVSLIKGVDYTISYQNNDRIGTAKAIVQGKGNFQGSVNYSYNIVGLYVTFREGNKYSYTGRAIKPRVSLSVKGASGYSVNLSENRDYTVTYANNVNTGTGYIYFTGTGDYYFQGRASFTIGKANLSSCALSVSGPSFVYTGGFIYPAVTVASQTQILINGRDYSVSYSNNQNIGTASVQVTGIGNYTGALRGTYTIVPQGTNLTSLSKKSKGFKAKWKKQKSNTNGYQLQYSLNSDFSDAKIATISKNKTTSKTVSKLKKKQYYYVRIRTFKLINGVSYCSPWSAVKRVKTK